MKDKLSYLSKYGNLSATNASGKPKKKRKEKKRKENKTLLRDLDEDDHLQNSLGEDNSNDGEDGPVICIPEGLSASNVNVKKLQLKQEKNKSSFVPIDDYDSKKNANEKVVSKGLRNRYDSEEDCAIEVHSRRNRRRRESSPESSRGDQRWRRRGRYDSEQESDSDDKNRRKEKSRRGRRRYSSSSSPEVTRPRDRSRQRHDSSSEEEEISFDKSSHQRIPSTTYRDSRTGLKVDMQHRYENVISNHQRDRLTSVTLNKGKVQKEQEEALNRSREFVKTQAFARSVGDRDTEIGIKDVIRTEDPMATHALKQVKFYCNSFLFLLK